jgi:hypothetical protein
MATDTDSQINNLSNQSLNTILQVLSNNGISYDNNIVQSVVKKMNDELLEINNNLSTNMIQSFTKINNDTFDSIYSSFNRPNEIKEQEVEQCKNIYMENTTFAGFQLTCSKQFEDCINNICSQFNIPRRANLYNKLATNLESIRMQMETQFYNMYSSFSYNNSMFIDKAISSTLMTQQTMNNMQEELNEQQIMT